MCALVVDFAGGDCMVVVQKIVKQAGDVMSKSWQAVLALGLLILLPQASFAADVYDCHPKEEFHWQDGSLQKSEKLHNDIFQFDIGSGQFVHTAAGGSSREYKRQTFKLLTIQLPKTDEDVVATNFSPGAASHIILRIRGISPAILQNPHAEDIVKEMPSEVVMKKNNISSGVLPHVRQVTLPYISFMITIDDAIYVGGCDALS
jgi:hypothetical protein